MYNAPWFRNGWMCLRIGMVGGIVAASTGCASLQHKRISTRQLLDTGPQEDVTLSPGDQLEIRFFYNPELNTEQPIRPDGKIALQLIGAYTAAGKSPDQLRLELMEAYENRVEKADINVIVRNFAQRVVYVGGEVRDPGQQDMPGHLTALDAVMLAGGFNVKSEPTSVIIIRHQDGQRFGCALNLDKAIKGGPHEPFYLHSHDIIYVPASKVANANTWIDQYISKMIPSINLPIFFQVN